MAIDTYLKKKIGEQLANWIYLGIRTGAKRGVEVYEKEKATNLDGAILQLKRAIDLPHRARERINQFISDYGQPFLVECMQIYDSTVSLSELNAELTTLENYCQNLFDRQQGGESWDDLAIDLASNIEKESDKWVFPFPVGYTDIWGE